MKFLILFLAMLQRLCILAGAVACAYYDMPGMAAFLCVCVLILDVPREK